MTETTQEERDEWSFLHEAMPTDRCADISVDECLRLLNDANHRAQIERQVRELAEFWESDPGRTIPGDSAGHELRAILDPPDSEPAEGAGHLDAGDALRRALSDPETMQRVTERAAERQDAMLERRETLEAVGYAAIGDDGNVKGLWVLRDWDHAEVFADSCGCSLAPVFFGPQGNALAAAPQPQEGESDE